MRSYKHLLTQTYFNNVYRSVVFAVLNIIICFFLQVNMAEAKTTSTTGAGLWGDASKWSNGLPADGDIVNINHVMDFTNVNINIGANTTYNFNAGSDGSYIPLSLGMSSSTSVLNITSASIKFAGGINLNAGVINVHTGGTLTVTNQINQAGTQINIEEGANFNVTGSYLNNGGNIAVDGLLAITGTYDGQNANAVVTGSGDITTTGHMHGLNGTTIFGVINPDCGGPCSGRNLCGRIAASSPASAAYCSTPITLTGSVNNNGGYTPTYQWQSSATNTEAGFSNLSGATNATITVSPAAKTYYRIKVTVNNCTSISPVSVVSVSTCSKTWTGATDTDWFKDSNWSPAGVPTSADDVIIPNVTPFPIISGVANAKDVIVNTSGILVFSSGTLNVYGNFINNGSFTASSGTTLAFRGNVTQALSGASILYNLLIDNTASPTNVTGVSIFTPTTVKGTISLVKGKLTTDLFLSIDFNAGGNIGYASTDAGEIVGNVIGYRQVVARTHYIAAPFSGVTSAQVGLTTPLWVSPYWKMYSKDFTNQNWIAVTNTITPMPLGDGFSVAFTTSAPLRFEGSYDHTFTLTGDSYSNAAADKYILIGNPYPSTLDWNNASGWTKTNVGDAIYYWDPANSRTASYVSNVSTNGGTRFIPAMQAFMVTTTGSGGFSSVSINNAARISPLQAFFRDAQDDIVRLTLISGADSNHYDETVIRFNEMATDSFDYDLDANKILNTGIMPSVYTTSKNRTYSINSFESVDSTPYVPVGAKLPVDGLYKLKIAGTNPNIDYILVDKLLGTSQSIDSDSVYTFSGERTDDVNRFELQFRVSETPPSGVHSANLNGGLGIYSSIKGFVIKTDRYAGEAAEIEILDVTGNSIKVMSGKSLTQGSTYIPLDIAEGTYLVKVNVEGNTFAGMIVLVK